MDMTDQEHRAFLKDEYLLLQHHYEDFDRRTLTIKGWIATGSAAALAIGFTSSYRYVYLLPIGVAVLAAVFWYLEAYWRLFQDAIGFRIRVIEALFRGDREILITDPTPFQTYRYWYLSYGDDQPLYEHEMNQAGRKDGGPRKWWKRIGSAALHQYVYLPYAPIIILSIGTVVLFLLTKL